MWEFNKYAPLFSHRDTFLRKFSLGDEGDSKDINATPKSGEESSSHHSNKKKSPPPQINSSSQLPSIFIDKRENYSKARKNKLPNFLSTPQSVASSFSLQLRDFPLTSKSRTNINTPRIENPKYAGGSNASTFRESCDEDNKKLFIVDPSSNPSFPPEIRAKSFIRQPSKIRAQAKSLTISKKRDKEDDIVVEETKNFLNYLRTLENTDTATEDKDKEETNNKKRLLPFILPKNMAKKNSLRKNDHRPSPKRISTEHTDNDDHSKNESPSNRPKAKSNKKIMFNIPEKNNAAINHMSASNGVDGLTGMLNEFSERIRRNENWVSVNRGDRSRDRSESRKKILMVERSQRDDEVKKRQRRSEKESREKNLNRDFYEILKRVVFNFNQLLDKFGSVRKTSLIFRNLLKRVQKEELNKIFFNGDGQLIEPFSEENIEKNVTIIDYFIHDGEKFMYHKLDVSQMENLIKLNELLEERNLQECVTNIYGTYKNLEVEQKKINEMEKTFERDISKRRLLKQIKPIGALNLERMRLMKNSIIENLEEIERKYGSCGLISNQNRAVSDSLEKVIKSYNLGDENEI